MLHLLAAVKLTTFLDIELTFLCLHLPTRPIISPARSKLITTRSHPIRPDSTQPNELTRELTCSFLTSRRWGYEDFLTCIASHCCWEAIISLCLSAINCRQYCNLTCCAALTQWVTSTVAGWSLEAFDCSCARWRPLHGDWDGRRPWWRWWVWVLWVELWHKLLLQVRHRQLRIPTKGTPAQFNGLKRTAGSCGWLLEFSSPWVFWCPDMANSTSGNGSMRTSAYRYVWVCSTLPLDRFRLYMMSFRI